MKLAALAVKRPVTSLMMMAIIVLLGWISLSRLPIDLFPDIEVPVIGVLTTYPDAGPFEVENLVTRPMEAALATVNNVKNITSFSSRGSSTVIAEFDWGINMDFASLDVREKVDQVRGYLPDEAGAPIVIKYDPGAMPVMQLVLKGSRPAYELRYIAEDTVKSRLERLDGVASVDITGGQEREIRVVLHPGLLAAHGISIDTVSQALRAASLNLPAGSIRDGGLEYTLRTVGEFATVDEIRSVKVPTAGGGLVNLSDIGEIVDGYKDVTTISRHNGQPTIMLSVQKEAGSNTVRVAEAVRKAVEGLNRELGGDLSLEIAMDSSVYIQQAIKEVAGNAVTGAVLAVAILLLFLRSIRPTLVIGVAIPISILAAFVMVYFSKTTLNLLSLGGLALGVGMLVDNSIVVLESIFRHRELGKKAREAAVIGTEEVGMAVTASTLTTISVFVPIVFVSGLTAEIFRDLALTVTFSLLASLLVAVTLVPMLASQVLGNSRLDAKDSRFTLVRWMSQMSDRMRKGYSRLIAWALRHRGATIGIAAATLVVSLLLVPLVGMEFMPSMDQGTISISVSMPRGTRLDDTDAIVRDIEDFLAAIPEIDTISSTLGSGGTDRASISVQLVPIAQRTRQTRDIATLIHDFTSQIPGAEITVSSDTLITGAFGQAIQVRLRGDDLDMLELVSQELIGALKEIEGTRQFTTSLDETSPEIQVQINRDRAAAQGISVAQIASTLRAAVSGTTAAKFRSEGKEIDVTVCLGEEWRDNPQAVGNIPIPTLRGTLVPLKDVATLQYGTSPIQITRSGQSRTVTVTGDAIGRPLNMVMEDVRKVVDSFPFPEGISVEYGGEYSQMTESFADLGQAMLLGILLVYMILASQFESLVQPFIIMVTLPLSIVGVILGLLIGGCTFNVVSFVGAIILVGIVVNNAIVLIDYINQLRAQGMERNEAVVTAGEVRLRPILMTTLTTVLGLVPLALATGEGSEMGRPLAYTVMGGLTTSTLLTLIVVPVVYTLVDGLGRRIARLLGGSRKGAASGAEAVQ
ncbi:MAG TPA: efflux RND transporter permease subunit [Firmicutes bacterium]|nr:efflux RND transporter permease subunit [Bacillota bacterium]